METRMYAWWGIIPQTQDSKNPGFLNMPISVGCIWYLIFAGFSYGNGDCQFTFK